MGIWQKRQGSWARWWNTQSKVNPTQIHEQMGHPVDPSFPVYDEHGVHVVDEVGEAETHVVADERAPLYHHF